MHHMHSLFSIPVAHCKIEDALADKIEKIFLERLDKLPMRDVDNQYSDFTEHQPDQILNVEKDLPELYAILNDFKYHYANETTLRTTDGCFRSWTQDYRDEGQRHVKHHHGTCGISGVYWIRANEFAEPLTFHTPNIANKYTNYEIQQHDNQNVFAAQTTSFPAEKGVILLFPSYLEHEVGPSKPGTIRSTLAFNFNFINENI